MEEISNFSKEVLQNYLESKNNGVSNKLEMIFKYEPATCNTGNWSLLSLEDNGEDRWDYTPTKNEIFTLEAVVLEINPNKENSPIYGASYATGGLQLVKLPVSDRDLLELGVSGGWACRTVVLNKDQTISAFSTMESFDFAECQDPSSETFLVIIGYVEGVLGN